MSPRDTEGAIVLRGCVPMYLMLVRCSCQGTLAAVPTRANIHASALNKGGSGDPGVRSAVSCTARGQVVSGIYILGTTADTIC
jgi:hypothetical protein